MPKRYREPKSGYTVITRSQAEKRQRIENLAQDEEATFYQSDSSLEADLIIPKERDSYYLEIDTLEQDDCPMTDREIDLGIDDSSSENDSFLSEEEPRIKKLTKEKILKFLESVLHINLEKTVLADIVFSEKGNELTIVGRGKLDETSKQLCHIIPVLFIKNAIKAALKSSSKPIEVMKYLSNNIVILARNQTGFAISKSQLEMEDYASIATKCKNLSDRVLSVGGNDVLLFSPGKAKHVFNTPKKKGLAEKIYPSLNIKYISKAMQVFQEAIQESTDDEMNLTTTCEALARFILIMCSKGENVSFAPQGNTLRYEIRLYEDADNAAKAGSDYTVVKSRELVGLNPNEISECIRVVDCEGANLKKYSSALNILDSILGDLILYDAPEPSNLTKYNEKNISIKLSNNLDDISPYNKDLTAENCKNSIYYHIAKQLYLAFDLKALEDTVLAPSFFSSNEDIIVYASAKGGRKANYCLMEGNKYREFSINSASGFKDDSFFRSKEKDIMNLPQKLAKLFTLATIIIKSFYEEINYPNKKPLDHTLKLLVNLAALDYELNKEEHANLEEQTLNNFNERRQDINGYNAGEDIEIFAIGDHNILQDFT